MSQTQLYITICPNVITDSPTVHGHTVCCAPHTVSINLDEPAHVFDGTHSRYKHADTVRKALRHHRHHHNDDNNNNGVLRRHASTTLEKRMTCAVLMATSVSARTTATTSSSSTASASFRGAMRGAAKTNAKPRRGCDHRCRGRAAASSATVAALMTSGDVTPGQGAGSPKWPEMHDRLTKEFGVKTVDASDLASVLSKGNVVLVDVRQSLEFDEW